MKANRTYSYSDDFFLDRQVILYRSRDKVSYPSAIKTIQHWQKSVQHDESAERLWLLEHPCLITAGSRARECDLLQPHRFPLYETRRGGQYTYHGPGQRIAYFNIDLRRRLCDVRAFVATIEKWIISTLACFGIEAYSHHEHVGVFVKTDEQSGYKEKKIAAIGVHLSRWVSSHGVAINIYPNLSHYEAIVPCGLRSIGVTSLQEMGLKLSFEQFDECLVKEFEKYFAPTKKLPGM